MQCLQIVEQSCRWFAEEEETQCVISTRKYSHRPLSQERESGDTYIPKHLGLLKVLRLVNEIVRVAFIAIMQKQECVHVLQTVHILQHELSFSTSVQAQLKISARVTRPLPHRFGHKAIHDILETLYGTHACSHNIRQRSP